MSISIAHMIEMVHHKSEKMSKRAEDHMSEVRSIILRKRLREHSNFIDFFFAFQFVLAGAFIVSMCYA